MPNNGKDNNLIQASILSKVKSSAGFTLIELMITLAVFTIGISAALGLAMSNYNNSRDNLDKIIAANLAREGIELIRNVRDSNWLRIEANDMLACGGFCSWDEGLNVNTNYVYIDYNDIFPQAFGGNCAVGNEQCVIACPNCKLYKDVNGFYNHDNSGTLTNYSRAIKLEKICVDESLAQPEINESIYDMNLPCGALETYIGIQVTAHVQWIDNGTKYVEIMDKFYNWRR
ncbi:MAG: prepilin-type N-terminal cleavage/methylation domain-containing protein [Patescibacteria group bacterium]